MCSMDKKKYLEVLEVPKMYVWMYVCLIFVVLSGISIGDYNIVFTKVTVEIKEHGYIPATKSQQQA